MSDHHIKKIFITGSTDGLGLIAAKLLMDQGHEVILHAKNQTRAHEVYNKLSSKYSGQFSMTIADLRSVLEIKSLVGQVNQHGKLDAIIHNAGLGLTETPEYNEYGMTSLFSVNVFAPFYLSKYIVHPHHLIYLSSDLHRSGNFDLEDAQFKAKPWSASKAYNDSKLYVTMMMKYFSRFYYDSIVTAVDPGWVPTKMGGSNAPDNLILGAQTQVWLAGGNLNRKLSGEYLFHRKVQDVHPDVLDDKKIDQLALYLDTLSR